MDYQTAHRFLINQVQQAESDSETILARLRQGKPPVPGQVTSLLLALKVVFQALQQEAYLERDLVHALYRLATESRQQFEVGRMAGVEWPPLLDEDLTRIAIAVKSIFAGVWEG